MISTFPYIFLSFPLSYVSLMFILISRTFQSVTLKGGPILLTFALFSRGDIFSRTTFPNLHSHSLFMALWFLRLPCRLAILGPLIILRQGSRPNTYSWAFYPYTTHTIIDKTCSWLFRIYQTKNKNNKYILHARGLIIN